ncbi:hypothetical protein Y1Q_0016686 [Alligator mississippiensis]|nr:hypothetical protein Y1Q_0016686 [Alligator mississippiensis]
MVSIALSYALILSAVLSPPTKGAQIKAFSSCSAHICIILAFCMPGLFTIQTHHYDAHVLFANLYLLLPLPSTPLSMAKCNWNQVLRLLQWDHKPFLNQTPKL